MSSGINVGAIDAISKPTRPGWSGPHGRALGPLGPVFWARR